MDWLSLFSFAIFKAFIDLILVLCVHEWVVGDVVGYFMDVSLILEGGL